MEMVVTMVSRPKKDPRYEVGDIVNGRKITKVCNSLGKYHFYKTICEKCGIEKTLAEITLMQTRVCKNCFKFETRRKYEQIVPKHERRKT